MFMGHRFISVVPHLSYLYKVHGNFYREHGDAKRTSGPSQWWSGAQVIFPHRSTGHVIHRPTSTFLHAVYGFSIKDSIFRPFESFSGSKIIIHLYIPFQERSR